MITDRPVPALSTDVCCGTVCGAGRLNGRERSSPLRPKIAVNAPVISLPW